MEEEEMERNRENNILNILLFIIVNCERIYFCSYLIYIKLLYIYGIEEGKDKDKKREFTYICICCGDGICFLILF